MPSCSGAFHGTSSTRESPSLAFAFSKAPLWAKPEFPKEAAPISTARPEGCQRTHKLSKVLMQYSLGCSFLPLYLWSLAGEGCVPWCDFQQLSLLTATGQPKALCSLPRQEQKEAFLCLCRRARTMGVQRRGQQHCTAASLLNGSKLKDSRYALGFGLCFVWSFPPQENLWHLPSCPRAFEWCALAAA